MSSLASDCWMLTKPRLTRMVVLTSLCGAAVAPGHLDLWGWAMLTLASWAIVASANIVNCFLERDVDALMERTRDRPLVTGTMNPYLALAIGFSLATAALLGLALSGHVLTAWLALLGFASYVALYTPLKRHSMAALFVGAIPGAIPPMMGWSAVTGKLETGAWILFGILFFWQLPHFISISIRWQEDYDRAGLKTLSGRLGEPWAQRHMVFYSTLLIITSLLPYPMGLAGGAYALITAVIGGLFVGLCVAGFFKVLHFNWNRLIFFGSLVYLPLVLGVWIVDQWLTRVR